MFLVGQGSKVHPFKGENQDVVKRIELKLFAFGVEAERFPNIDAVVDLQSDTSLFRVSYYDPKFRDSSYRLTKATMESIRFLVARGDINKLKPKYEVSSTDLPTSTAIFYFSDMTINIEDYVLEAPSPLKEFYGFVYKLNINFR